MDIPGAGEFSASVVLTVTDHHYQKEIIGKRDPYTTLEPLNDVDLAREKLNISQLSLTVAVRSPRTKIKHHQSNSLLPNRDRAGNNHIDASVALSPKLELDSINKLDLNIDDPLI